MVASPPTTLGPFDLADFALRVRCPRCAGRPVPNLRARWGEPGNVCATPAGTVLPVAPHRDRIDAAADALWDLVAAYNTARNSR